MSPALHQWLQRGFTFHHHGLNVFYRMEGKGACLLLVHGYPYNGYDFKELLPSLAARFQVIIPDMPGMGFSDKPAAYPYSFRAMASMYKELLSQLGITEIHVLSHDLGNSVVQEMLACFEEGDTAVTIRSIAFLNGGLFSDVYRPRLIQVLLSRSPKPVGKLLSRLISKNSIEKATRSVFGKNTQPPQELLNDYWDILNYNSGKSLAWKIGRLVFEKTIHQKRWINAMQQTKVPMCLINGPADPNSGMHMAKRYGELIPDADIRFMQEQIGHWPQLEDPEDVLRHYDAFLQENGFSTGSR